MVLERKDLIQLFGLNENYTEEELTKAYRQLAKIVHPDKLGNEQLFKHIMICKDILSETATSYNVEGQKTSKQYPKNKTKESYYVSFEALDTTTIQDLAKVIAMISTGELHEIRQNITLEFSNLFGTKKSKIEVMLVTRNVHSLYDFLVKFESKVKIPEKFKGNTIIKVNVEVLEKKYKFFIFEDKQKINIDYLNEWYHRRGINMLLDLEFTR